MTTNDNKNSVRSTATPIQAAEAKLAAVLDMPEYNITLSEAVHRKVPRVRILDVEKQHALALFDMNDRSVSWLATVNVLHLRANALLTKK